MWDEHLTDVRPQQVFFFFLMVELLFFAQSVFVGRFLLHAQGSRCLAVLFSLHYLVETRWLLFDL